MDLTNDAFMTLTMISPARTTDSFCLLCRRSMEWTRITCSIAARNVCNSCKAQVEVTCQFSTQNRPYHYVKLAPQRAADYEGPPKFTFNFSIARLILVLHEMIRTYSI